jgi:hypothetical protein
MKNWFLVAVLALGLFVNLYASPPDPGGMVGTLAANTTTLDQTFHAALGHALPDLGAASFALRADQQAAKEAVQTVAGLAVVSLGTLLLAVIFAPYLLIPTRRTAYDGPSTYPLGKRTISNVRKSSSAQAGSPAVNSIRSTEVNKKAGALAKRTKSELLKHRSAS